jgi:cytochrome P450
MLSGPPADLLEKLFQIQAGKPEFRENWLVSMVLTNFGAGVETIGITVSTLICKIIDNPGCQEKIQAEIDAALKAGTLNKTPKWRQLQDSLPYLNACINESMRLHPVIGMALPRKVPEGGVELEGHFLPEGVSFLYRLSVFADFLKDYGRH